MSDSIDQMQSCRYAGSDPEVLRYLVEAGSTKCEVPLSVLTAGGGGQYIERTVRAKIAAQASALEQEAADRAVLEARTAQQAAAEVAAAEAAKAQSEEFKEAERQRLRAELKAELREELGSLASSTMSASAALTGRAELLDERVRVAEERFQSLVADAEQRLNEMAAQYGEALQLNGKQSIDLYAISRRVEALESELARLHAERS